MTDPIMITPEQAESLAEHGLFVVDGEWDGKSMAGRTLDEMTVPPAVWVEADQPCETCDGIYIPCSHGQRVQHASDVRCGTEYDCPDCHGTGRKVVELELPPCKVCAGQTRFAGDCFVCPACDESGVTSLGLFTIQVRTTYGSFAAIATKWDDRD